LAQEKTAFTPQVWRLIARPSSVSVHAGKKNEDHADALRRGIEKK
jgi:hypothetical protein